MVVVRADMTLTIVGNQIEVAMAPGQPLTGCRRSFLTSLKVG